MSRRHLVLVYLAFALVSGSVLLYLTQPAQATTWFEENFTDVTDCNTGSLPTGWVGLSSPDVLECSAITSQQTDNSLRLNNGGALRGVTSPAISGPGATGSYTAGFWFNLSDVPDGAGPGQVWFVGGTAGGECGLFGPNTPSHLIKVGLRIDGNEINPLQPSVWSQGTGMFTDAGGTITYTAWHHVVWTIDEDANTYTTTLDDVEISSGDGISQPSSALTRFKMCANGLSGTTGVYVDLLNIGAPVIDSTAVTTGACNQAYSYQATADAENEVTWSLTVNPGYLSISSAGLITGIPTAGGVDDITVQVETSAGTDTQAYVITVTSCGGGGGSHTIVTGGGDAEPGSFVWCYGEECEPEEPDECNPNTKTITFQDDTVPRESVLTYIWDFGDGSRVQQSTNPTIVHTYPAFGEYTVTSALMLSDGTIYRQTQEVVLGQCIPALIGEVIPQLLAFIIATAVALWLVFVFTRNPKIMKWAFILTLIGVSGWTLFLEF